MSPRDALKMAQALDLDLVKVAPQAKPPVCKILDYGKYRFEMQKKEKEAKKNQKTTTLKEMRLSATIDTHDMEVKAKNVAKFLAGGDKVKVSIRFRGRQLSHTENGLTVMNTFLQMLGDKVAVEIRDAKVANILSLDGYAYTEQPLVNGRGFAINVHSPQEFAAFKADYAKAGGNSDAELFDKWMTFETYRKIKFHNDFE